MSEAHTDHYRIENVATQYQHLAKEGVSIWLMENSPDWGYILLPHSISIVQNLTALSIDRILYYVYWANIAKEYLATFRSLKKILWENEAVMKKVMHTILTHKLAKFGELQRETHEWVEYPFLLVYPELMPYVIQELQSLIHNNEFVLKFANNAINEHLWNLHERWAREWLARQILLENITIELIQFLESIISHYTINHNRTSILGYAKPKWFEWDDMMESMKERAYELDALRNEHLSNMPQQWGELQFVVDHDEWFYRYPTNHVATLPYVDWFYRYPDTTFGNDQPIPEETQWVHQNVNKLLWKIASPHRKLN